MLDSDVKADLHCYLQDAREALLWKLEGLSEYDVRRPLVPTGTNLLGLVKHVTAVEIGYFGDTFGRPGADQMPWDESDPMSDMFAFPEESREILIALYRRTWAHSDATIDALPLDTTGHAGHADLVRELIDGAIGCTASNPNLPPGDQPWWQAHYDRVAQAARSAPLSPPGDPGL